MLAGVQVIGKLQAAEGRLHKMQGVISTDAEAEKCLSGLLERMHRRLVGLVNAAPEFFEVSAGDHKVKELHIAPRVHEMLESDMDEVSSTTGSRRLSFVENLYPVRQQHAGEIECERFVLCCCVEGCVHCCTLSCNAGDITHLSI